MSQRETDSYLSERMDIMYTFNIYPSIYTSTHLPIYAYIHLPLIDKAKNLNTPNNYEGIF
jgi:hypothetical protein